MADEEQQAGPDLKEYAGTGEDLTEEQRAYLNTYAQQEPADGDAQAEVGAGSLSENSESEWA